MGTTCALAIENVAADAALASTWLRSADVMQEVAYVLTLGADAASETGASLVPMEPHW